MRPGLISAVLVSAMVAPAGAAECTFATAIYKQPETLYELRFQPMQQLYRFGGTTNVFFLHGPEIEKPPMAWVIWNNGESRPTGRLMNNCPDDAETDEDFADCTLWSGVMYELTEGGAKLLPHEDEAPPKKILLANFGRALRYSGDILENPPWDVFEFSRCGVDETPKAQ